MNSGLNQADEVWDLCVCMCVSRIAVISTIGSDTQVISRHYGLLEGLRSEIWGGFGLSLISVCHGCPHTNYPPHPACPSLSAVASFCVFLWIVKELHAHTQSAPHLWGVCDYRPVSGGIWVITVHFLTEFPLLSYLQRTRPLVCIFPSLQEHHGKIYIVVGYFVIVVFACTHLGIWTQLLMRSIKLWQVSHHALFAVRMWMMPQIMRLKERCAGNFLGY